MIHLNSLSASCSTNQSIFIQNRITRWLCSWLL